MQGLIIVRADWAPLTGTPGGINPVCSLSSADGTITIYQTDPSSEPITDDPSSICSAKEANGWIAG